MGTCKVKKSIYPPFPWKKGQVLSSTYNDYEQILWVKLSHTVHSLGDQVRGKVFRVWQDDTSETINGISWQASEFCTGIRTMKIGVISKNKFDCMYRIPTVRIE